MLTGGCTGMERPCSGSSQTVYYVPLNLIAQTSLINKIANAECFFFISIYQNYLKSGCKITKEYLLVLLNH